jgi:hypothetical protein
VAVADLTGNGIPDLVLTHGAGGVVVLLGNGDGTTFRFGGAFPTDGEPFAVAVADLNGDGLPDIVAANSFGGSVGVLINTGEGFGPGGGGLAPRGSPGGHGPAGADLLVPTQAQPSSVPTPVPTAEASGAAEQAAADAVFASHLEETAGLLLPAGLHRKAEGTAGLLDPLTEDLG